MNKRDQIIETATELFAERGYENTPVSLICATTGVSKGLISHHFGSKDALLREIFTKKTESMFTFDNDLDEPPKQRLLNFIDSYFSHLVSERSFFQLSLCLVLQPNTREVLDDLIKERSLRLRRKLRETFEQIDPQNAPLHEHLLIAELDGITINHLYENFPLEQVKTYMLDKYSNL